MKKGFSLIEIIVSLGIIAIIATAATLNFTNQRVKSREARRIQDVGTIASALRSYEASGQDLPISPNNNQKVDSGVLTPVVTAGFLNEIPKDPLPGGSDGVHLFCENYMYGSRFTSTQTLGTNTIGTRSFFVAFGSEVSTTSSTNEHPYSNAIYLQANNKFCNGTRSLGIVMGDRL